MRTTKQRMPKDDGSTGRTGHIKKVLSGGWLVCYQFNGGRPYKRWFGDKKDAVKFLHDDRGRNYFKQCERREL